MNKQIEFIPKKEISDKQFHLNPKWRSFDEAKEYVRDLNLKSLEEWYEFAKGQMPNMQKPDDIPFDVKKFYKYHGWAGYVDFLGLPKKEKSRFQRFKYARSFARSLHLETKKQWDQYCSGNLPERGIKPSNIPVAPNIVYKNKGWMSWNDWLGCGVVTHKGKTYEPFVDARDFSRSLKLKNVHDWFAYCNGDFFRLADLPETIPTSPNEVYKDQGWISWRDWLGLPVIKAKYQNFEKVKEFARSLKLKSSDEWKKYCAGLLINKPPIPGDVPVNPHKVYEEWVNWGDFLGTGTIATQQRKYRSFEDARAFAQSLNFKGQNDWFDFAKGKKPELGLFPDDISSHPFRTYKDQWISWGDWLGTGFIAVTKRKFRSFKEAKTFVGKLKIKSTTEWNTYCKEGIPGKPDLPIDIPTNPHRTYKTEWKDWGDFLGTGFVAVYKREYRPFLKARAFIRKLKLKNINEWKEYRKGAMPEKGSKPKDIPTNPNRTYAGEWISMKDWLGTAKEN